MNRTYGDAEAWRKSVRLPRLAGIAWLLGGICLLVAAHGQAAVRVAGPDDYLEALSALEPGDTLALEPGTYDRGLPVHDVRGTDNAEIHIAGPERGREAVFEAQRGRNTVSIVDSAYVTLRNLRIDGRGLPVDGVKAEGHARFAHHITLQNLVIENLGGNRQVVGISTKCPAWNWTLRGNVVRGAGTGLYLGDSDGSAPFIGGIIEHNLVENPIGYAMQIKHQKQRPSLAGMPGEPSRTVIRYNVFAKGENASTGPGARPNLLVGHFPPTGAGSSDLYAIYGNLFYNNPTERLFQGEGNVALYDNLFVNPGGDALAIMPHKGHPRRIAIFHNTIVAAGTGIYLQATDKTEQTSISGNAIFAERPLSGEGVSSEGNIVNTYRAVADHLRAPMAQPGALNLLPRGDSLTGNSEVPPDLFWQLPDAGLDFDGRRRQGEGFGAYAAGATRPAWVPALEVRPPLAPTGD